MGQLGSWQPPPATKLPHVATPDAPHRAGLAQPPGPSFSDELAGRDPWWLRQRWQEGRHQGQRNVSWWPALASAAGAGAAQGEAAFQATASHEQHQREWQTGDHVGRRWQGGANPLDLWPRLLLSSLQGKEQLRQLPTKRLREAEPTIFIRSRVKPKGSPASQPAAGPASGTATSQQKAQPANQAQATATATPAAMPPVGSRPPGASSDPPLAPAVPVPPQAADGGTSADAGGFAQPEGVPEQKESNEEAKPLFVPACLKASDMKFLIQQGIEIPGLEKYRLHYDIKTESAAELAKHVDFCEFKLVHYQTMYQSLFAMETALWEAEVTAAKAKLAALGFDDTASVDPAPGAESGLLSRVSALHSRHQKAMAKAESDHAAAMADLEASILELRAQQATAMQAFQIQQSANEELLIALQARLDAFAPTQQKVDELRAQERSFKLGNALDRRVNPSWCAQNGLGSMPPEGLKALFAVFLDALQEVQPAPVPEQTAATQPGTTAAAPPHPATTAATPPPVEAPATPLVFNAALVVGANEITMQQSDRGVIRGSMWSADTNSEGLQEEQEDLFDPSE